jgi:hypothetical protein
VLVYSWWKQDRLASMLLVKSQPSIVNQGQDDSKDGFAWVLEVNSTKGIEVDTFLKVWVI